MKKRHLYNLHHNVCTQGKLGQLIPFMKLEVNPGDTFSGKIGLLLRLQSMWKPLLHDLYVDSYVFYVPYRLCWSGWEDFLAAGPQPDPPPSEPGVPYYYVSDPMLFMPEFANGNSGYVNGQPLPTGVSPMALAKAQGYTQLHRQAYNLIWNEWFRDQQLQNPISGGALIDLYANNKRHYWTELRTQQQIGFEATAPVTLLGTPGDVTGASVNAQDILRAIALQKQMVKRATYGTRYVDILRSYGVNVTVAMLQRPEVVAAGHGIVNITDIVSTNNGAQGSGTESLGLYGGYGVHGHRCNFRRKSFNEHGVLLGIVVVRAPPIDSTMIDFMDKARDYESFYDPALELMPQANILSKDMFGYWPNGNANSLVGYTPYYEWFRKATNRCHVELTSWPPFIEDTDNSTTREIASGGGAYAFSMFTPPFRSTVNSTGYTWTVPQFWSSLPTAAGLASAMGGNIGGVQKEVFSDGTSPWPLFQVAAVNGVRAVRLLGRGTQFASSGAT